MNRVAPLVSAQGARPGPRLTVSAARDVAVVEVRVHAATGPARAATRVAATTVLLAGGPGRRPSAAARLDSLGARAWAIGDDFGITFALRCRPGDAETALGIVVAALLDADRSPADAARIAREAASRPAPAPIDRLEAVLTAELFAPPPVLADAEQLVDARAAQVQAEREALARTVTDVVVVGDAPPTGRLRRVLGPMPEPRPVRVDAALPSSGPVERRRVTGSGSGSTVLVVVAPRSEHGPAAERLAVHAVGGHVDARLQRRLRQRDGLSYDVGAHLHRHPAGRWLVVRARCAVEVADQVVDTVLEELVQVHRHGLEEREVTVSRLLAAAEVARSTADYAGRANALTGYLASGRRAEALLSAPQALREAPLERVVMASRDLTDLTRAAIGLVEPGGATEGSDLRRWRRAAQR